MYKDSCDTVSAKGISTKLVIVPKDVLQIVWEMKENSFSFKKKTEVDY